MLIYDYEFQKTIKFERELEYNPINTKVRNVLLLVVAVFKNYHMFIF